MKLRANFSTPNSLQGDQAELVHRDIQFDSLALEDAGGKNGVWHGKRGEIQKNP